MATDHMTLSTDRLAIGPWKPDDAPAGLGIFGRDEVTHWLTPAMEPIHDAEGMRATLESWTSEDAAASVAS